MSNNIKPYPVEYGSDFTLLRKDGGLDVYVGPVRDTQQEAEADIVILSMLKNFTGTWKIVRLQYGTPITVVKEGSAGPAVKMQA